MIQLLGLGYRLRINYLRAANGGSADLAGADAALDACAAKCTDRINVVFGPIDRAHGGR